MNRSNLAKVISASSLRDQMKDEFFIALEACEDDSDLQRLMNTVNHLEKLHHFGDNEPRKLQ